MLFDTEFLIVDTFLMPLVQTLNQEHILLFACAHLTSHRQRHRRNSAIMIYAIACMKDLKNLDCAVYVYVV